MKAKGEKKNDKTAQATESSRFHLSISIIPSSSLSLCAMEGSALEEAGKCRRGLKACWLGGVEHGSKDKGENSDDAADVYDPPDTEIGEHGGEGYASGDAKPATGIAGEATTEIVGIGKDVAGERDGESVNSPRSSSYRIHKQTG